MKSKLVSKSPSVPRAVSEVEAPAPEGPSSRRQPALKQILVAIDFSECSVGALDYALMLARGFHAKLILLHVVEPAIYPDSYLVAASTLEEKNDNLMAASRERLVAIGQAARLQGLSVELLVRMGRAQSEIPDTAKATGSDLIVLGAQGQSGLKQVVLGGTAERVLRHAHCPVLTVGQS